MTNVEITDAAVDQWLADNDPEYGQEKHDHCDTWLRFMVGADGAADWLCGHDDEDLTLSDIFQTGTPENSGYALEVTGVPEVQEYCQWDGCLEVLYGLQEARKAGRPRKYCPGHQRDAEARRRRMQRQGITAGRHRNLSYRPKGEPKPKAVWIGNPSEGGKSIDQYEQFRQVWKSRNLPCRVR
ncbi:hypothetical protein [Streptomyces sp. NBC_00728]|uniref:hypothetical protein n=1 Tax=Streptomyces sp. NBC_00728 TaxID=2903676 RepID=UPI0038685F4D